MFDVRCSFFQFLLRKNNLVFMGPSSCLSGRRRGRPYVSSAAIIEQMDLVGQGSVPAFRLSQKPDIPCIFLHSASENRARARNRNRKGAIRYSTMNDCMCTKASLQFVQSIRYDGKKTRLRLRARIKKLTSLYHFSYIKGTAAGCTGPTGRKWIYNKYRYAVTSLFHRFGCWSSPIGTVRQDLTAVGTAPMRSIPEN